MAQVDNLCYWEATQRGAARAPGAGVAFSAQPGWRSGESIERAEPTMGGASVRRRGTGSPEPAQDGANIAARQISRPPRRG